MKKRIKIGLCNFFSGLTPESAVELMLGDLRGDYEFDFVSDPDFLVVGPYGGDLPPGNYIKVFYGCENVRADMEQCDWAFGVEPDDIVNHPRYTQLRWGSDLALEAPRPDADEAFKAKKKFCVFLFGHRVPFRERFFRALSKYKPVDAPGRSMNNMPPFDVAGEGDWQSRKQQYLREYKFTIAFENSSYPGYHTEKLTDPLQASSIPIYWGDPRVAEVYNENAFVNFHQIYRCHAWRLPKLPVAYKPLSPNRPVPTFYNRAANRLNRSITKFEPRLSNFDGFRRLVDVIVELDKNDVAYRAKLREPIFRNSERPSRNSYVSQWRRIFG